MRSTDWKSSNAPFIINLWRHYKISWDQRDIKNMDVIFRRLVLINKVTPNPNQVMNRRTVAVDLNVTCDQAYEEGHDRRLI